MSTNVPLETIENGNLLPSRYVVKTAFESTVCGKVNMQMQAFQANKTLEDIGTFYRGINVTSKNVQDAQGKYKIINLADIQKGTVDIEHLPTYAIENNARVKSYKVEAGDLIISNKGPTKICVIPEHTGDVLISQNFVGIRLKTGYNAEYIKAFLESPLGEYLIASRKTGTAVAMINLKDLKEMPIVVEQLAMQNEIMAKYTEEKYKIEEELQALYVRMHDFQMDLYDQMGIKQVFMSQS